MKENKIKINKTFKTKIGDDTCIETNIVDLDELQKWCEKNLKNNIKYAQIHYGYNENNELDAHLYAYKIRTEYKPS